MCIHWFKEPHTILESKSSVGKRSHRTNVDHITNEVVVESIFNIGSDLRMITAVEHTMFTFVCYLVGNIQATVTKYAACHVKLYVWTKVHPVKCSSFKFISCS